MKILTSNNCPGCKAVKQVIAANNLVGVTFLNVEDSDENRVIAEDLRIQSVPALVAESGEVVYTLPKIIKFIKEQQ